MDAKNIDTKFKEKYHFLKLERLRLIKDIVKEKLNVDLDIEQFKEEDSKAENEDIDSELENMLETVDGKYEKGDLKEAEDMPEAVQQETDPTSLDALQTEEPAKDPTDDLEESPKEEEQKLNEDNRENPDEEKPNEEKPEDKSDGEKPAEETKETEDEKVKSDEQEAKSESKEDNNPENASTEEPVAPAENAEATPTNEVDAAASAPQIKAIPLEELAPLPTADELFGEVEKLMDDVEKGEEALEKNKFRQEQDLQDRLRRRRSKRKRIQDLQNENREN